MNEDFEFIDIEPQTRWERAYLNRVSETYKTGPIITWFILSIISFIFGLYFWDSPRPNLLLFNGACFLLITINSYNKYMANRFFRRILNQRSTEDSEISANHP